MLNISYLIPHSLCTQTPQAVRPVQCGQHQEIVHSVKTGIPELDTLIQRYQQSGSMPPRLEEALTCYQQTPNDTQILIDALLEEYKNDRSILAGMLGNLTQSLLHLAKAHQTDWQHLLLHLIEEGVSLSGVASPLARQAELLLKDKAQVVRKQLPQGRSNQEKQERNAALKRMGLDDAGLKAAIEKARNAGRVRFHTTPPR